MEGEMERVEGAGAGARGIGGALSSGGPARLLLTKRCVFFIEVCGILLWIRVFNWCVLQCIPPTFVSRVDQMI